MINHLSSFQAVECTHAHTYTPAPINMVLLFLFFPAQQPTLPITGSTGPLIISLCWVASLPLLKRVHNLIVQCKMPGHNIWQIYAALTLLLKKIGISHLPNLFGLFLLKPGSLMVAVCLPEIILGLFSHDFFQGFSSFCLLSGAACWAQRRRVRVLSVRGREIFQYSSTFGYSSGLYLLAFFFVFEERDLRKKTSYFLPSSNPLSVLLIL